MKHALVLAAASLLATTPALVEAHGNHISGTIVLGPCVAEAQAALSVDGTNRGLGCFVIGAVQGVTEFQLTADDGEADFDVVFTGGQYVNGPGDESGTGSGTAIIHLMQGDDAAEGFTWHWL